MAKKTPIETPDATKNGLRSNPLHPSLAKRLAARTGLGVGLLEEKLTAHADDAAIEDLLARNDLPTILGLLNPANKA
jgi:hypothetical protein